MRSRPWIWLAGIAGVCLVAFGVTWAVREPLRRSIESEMNRQLRGYTVRIARLVVHPLGLGVDFEGIVVTQTAHPEPPVADLPRVRASVQWSELFHGAIVADFLLEGPRLHIDRRHVQRELDDSTPVEKRGWQEAVQAMYPLRINELRVQGGDFAYLDEAPARPLHLSQIELRAANIRNVRSAERTYPSELQLAAVVFDSGTVRAHGDADFLALPHPALRVSVDLREAPIGYFRPIAARYNFDVRTGVLSASGDLEYRADGQTLRLGDLTLRELDAMYEHRIDTAELEKRRAKATAQAGAEVANQPGLQLQIDRAHIEGRLGYRQLTGSSPYRLVLERARLDLENLSNHFSDGVGHVELSGQFMGSGKTHAKAAFRPVRKGADFDVALQIEDADLRSLNDLLRAYGRIDVARGFFSLYSQLTVRDGQVDGYLKPLFRDVDLYDTEKESGKGLLGKLRQGAAAAAAKLLKNRSREEIATKVPISGRLEDPDASTWSILVGLLRNAFFDAILPGFDRETGGRVAREEGGR